MQADEDEPGYRHIIFKPQPINELGYCKYFTETSLGKAGIFWQQNESGFSMEIIVPVGSHATVYIPARADQTIRESGTLLLENSAVKILDRDEFIQKIELQSGDYNFSVN